MSKRKLELKAGCARSKNYLVEKASNLTCRVESFGRICQKFDERRKRWVSEMGFSGRLHLASGMHMPRQLAYWLLSRVDPIWKMLISPKGSEFKLSANQVHWILGIPNGGKCVPLKKNMRLDVKDQVEKLLSRYSYSWETKCTRYKGRAYVVKGIHVNSTIMDRVEGNWEENEEAEFKTLFLILSLHMVLFSTQSPRLSSDLLPALTCATECAKYDWCNLVLSKFLSSVSSFAKRLDATGNGGGSGGCLLFIVVFYLDRLIRDPLRWGTFPRITVWGKHDLRLAAKDDRISDVGEFGKLGMLDVAYVETHPLDARDTNGPLESCCKIELPETNSSPKPRRRRPWKGDVVSWFK